MKIIQISIEDFLGITHFKTDNIGKLNRITGGNGVGKTAVVKAIREAIKGGTGKDPKLIRSGSERAEILIDFDNDVNIRKLITQSGSSVKVVHAGQPIDKPQSWLRTIFGPFNFDPTDFFQASKKERREILLAAMPFTITAQDIIKLWDNDLPAGVKFDEIDFSKHGLEVLALIRDDVYKRRHEIGIEVTRVQKSIEKDKLDMPENFNQEEFADFNLSEITGKLSEIKSTIENQEGDKIRLQQLRQRDVDLQEEIADLRAKIAKKEQELEEVRNDGKKLRERVEGAVDNQKLKAKRDEYEQIINNYDQHQELRQRLKDIKRKESELEAAEATHDALDEFHNALANDIPRALLHRMKLPIDDLKFDEDTILINGIDVDKMSTSEQMKFSIAIAKALAGDLKVICIDRFESLDDDARKAFIEASDGDEFEYFVTQVTGGELKHESIGDLDHSSQPTTKTAFNPTTIQASF